MDAIIGLFRSICEQLCQGCEDSRLRPDPTEEFRPVFQIIWFMRLEVQDSEGFRVQTRKALNPNKP